MKKRLDQKVYNFAKKELPLIQANLIMRNDNGWIVFNRFKIEKHPDGFFVYDDDHFVRKFYSTKSAMSWCVAQKYKKYEVASQIATLDSNKERISAHVSFMRKLVNSRAKNVTNETAIIKLDRDADRLRNVSFELDKLIDRAKYWQQKGFNKNETY